MTDTSLSSEKTNAAMDKKGLKPPQIVLACVVLVLVIFGIWYYLVTRNRESTDDAQIDGNVVTMQTKISGYVTELDVTDNQRVKAGQFLFRIDPREYTLARDQARAALAQAQAQAEKAKADFDMAQISAPQKLALTQAQSAADTAARDYALSDYIRQSSLGDLQAIDHTTQTLKSANADLDRDQAQIAMADVIPQTVAEAKAQVDEAAAQVDQAEAQLAAAELNLGSTQVRAPQDGWVVQRNIQLGSFVAAGQSALSVVAPSFWVIANFKENQLNRMRVGQQVKIRVDAYPDLRLQGHVDSLQMGTGSRFSAFPAENATGNFIKIVQRVPVKIVIDRGLDPAIYLPLGLSAEPTVELQ